MDDELSIEHALETFITDIDGLYAGAPVGILTIGLLSGNATHAALKFARFIDPSDPTKFNLPLGKYRAFRRAQAKQQQTTRAAQITPRTFLVSMASQFDVFLSRLLHCLIRIRPDLLNSSERKLTFSELGDFESIEAVREHIIEVEIDSFLRKSLSEQFSWLEGKFDVKLRSGLAVWPELVELTQRRNLFVHADGVVSKQYMRTCTLNNVEVQNVHLGDVLVVDPAYLKRARDVLVEISVKLAQVLWRKIVKAGCEQADKQLNEFCFELLREGRYELASTLLDFAFIAPMKHPNKESELMLMVNRANSYLLKGDRTKCIEILGFEDWSAFDRKFRLANAILCGEYDKMVVLMKEISNANNPAEHDYRDWPLFYSVRERKDFLVTFNEIFHSDYVEKPNLELAAASTGPNVDEAKELGAVLLRVMQSEDMKGWVIEAAANIADS